MSKHTSSPQTTSKQALKAFFILLWTFTFYPVMIGLFFWIWYKGYHWGFGALIVISLLVLDPFWGLLGRNIVRGLKQK